MDVCCCDHEVVERDRSVSLPRIENRSIEEVIDITRCLDPIMKTLDNRVQSKAELKLEQFSSWNILNGSNQKNSKPNFVIKKRNILKEKEKIGSKLAKFTNRSENIVSYLAHFEENKQVLSSEGLHPIKLDLKIISRQPRNITPVMQRRVRPLSREKKTIKRKISHNQLHYDVSLNLPLFLIREGWKLLKTLNFTNNY